MGAVLDYDPRWPPLFEEEAALVRGALGAQAATVEHIGSTAVAGLPARPVIDLLLALDGDFTPALAQRLRRLGYVRVRARRSGRLSLRKGAPRTHSLHIASAGSDEWREALAFRDLLRRDASAAARYAELKRSLRPLAEHDPGVYSRAKGAFIGTALRGAPSSTTRKGRQRDGPSEVPTPGVEPASY